MKVLPVTGLVTIAAYISAQQTVSPHRRVIKLGVLLALMALMLRFDMVYSVYLFTILFPFPSSVSLGSTNSILMTIIPLIWAVRAASTNTKFFLRKTTVDRPILLFLFAVVVAFVNVNTGVELRESLKVLWRIVAMIMYFYMIVTFVNDERKLVLLTKLLCGVCALAMFTAVVELFFPGATIIPGWIGLRQQMGEGLISARVEGMRVGGSLGSHSLLSDFGTQTVFLMVYHAVKSRNPTAKLVWGAISMLTLVAILSTANRGAIVGLAVGFSYCLYLFRKQISVTRIVIIVGCVAAIVLATESVLVRHTVAVSVADRWEGTEFEGMVPDTRTKTWKPALERSLRRPFFGHGPYYNLGSGLSKIKWPHNGYIFYFHTIGLFGLGAFLWVIYRVWQYSKAYQLPGATGTVLGDISRILRVTLLVLLIEQLRTDHQRDDIYPYLVWLWFGLVTTTSILLQEKLLPAGEKEAS